MKKNLFILFVIVFCTPDARAQIITTFAGNGTSTYSADGLPATASSMVFHDVTIDRIGNIYIACRENERVRKIDTFGIAHTFAGGGSVLGDGGPATAADIDAPNGVALDGAGNLYISEEANRIRKVDVLGNITTFAGTGTAGFSGDGGQATAALINDPYGICADGAGNVYFADAYNNRIRKVDATGKITTVAGSGSPGLGSGSFSGDGGQATAATLSDPTSICFDNHGNFYIADDINNRVRMVDISGKITTIAGTGSGPFGGDGLAATVASLSTPFAVSFDHCGNLFICDNGNDRVRVVNSSGIINTVAGDGTGPYSGDGMAATAGHIYSPGGLAIDAHGNLYICDYINNRLRMVNNITNNAGLITGVDTACFGNTVTLADAVTGGVWTSSSGSISPAATSGVVTDTVVGIDTITYTVTSTGCRSTFPLYILPRSGVGIITGIDSVCPGYTVTLTDTAGGGIWTSSNTAVSTVAATGIVTGVVTGTDTITYTVESTGCSTSVPLRVRSHTSCSLGVDPGTNIGDGLKIFSNPAYYGHFSMLILSANPQMAQITVTNLLGEKVKELTVETGERVDVQINAPTGVYFVSAATTTGKWVEKLAIVR